MARRAFLVGICQSSLLFAQESTDLAQQLNLKNVASGSTVGSLGGDLKPVRPTAVQGESPDDLRRRLTEDERLDKEIKDLKKRERSPRRFADDLFQVRQKMTSATEGGVTEEYILGTGDTLSVNVFGSATFELPAQVDGRGEVVLPRVGAAKVAGQSLQQAKGTLQKLVNRYFSNATVDVAVVKLREVRINILGEVYKPGSYLVPSLSSLVNVLSLAGGPTSVGSYRDVRVLRGGKLIHKLDLYPLRADGVGNQNFYLQNGDHVHVPLSVNQVLLEGAFARVQPLQWQAEADGTSNVPIGNRLARAQGKEADETQLGKGGLRWLPDAKRRDGQTESDPTAWEEVARDPQDDLFAGGNLLAAEGDQDLGTHVDLGLDANSSRDASQQARPIRKPKKPLSATAQLQNAVGDRKLQIQTQEDATVHRMVFELLPGESVATVLGFAGGVHPWADGSRLSLRRVDESGRLSVQDVLISQAQQTLLQRGDVLSAFPKKDVVERMVSIIGYARVPGIYARTEGLRVGDLLKTGQQVLPDTYLGRGEVVRTSPSGETQFLAFDIRQAMAGDPIHNLLLEDRDRIELFRNERMRQREFVSLQGAMAKPGKYPFYAGMRASDLIFRAGIPLKSANRLVAELAKSKGGQPSTVVRLDLSRLISDDKRSPVALTEDALNPVLQPDDQVSIFEKPEFRIHRTVKVMGQVQRPGTYILDQERPSLSALIERAGGLTDQAMPSAGMFFRRPGGVPAETQAGEAQDVRNQAQALDPGVKGISDILERLNEAKFYPVDPTGAKAGAGALFKPPILHNLSQANLNRMVVDFRKALKKDADADPELMDGDEVVIPRKTDSAIVIGEVASPFAYYKIKTGMDVSDLLKLAGGTTRNADNRQIRLLKADGRLLDSWVTYRGVEPGDTVLVPQRIRRDSSWQENLQALTPLALILNAVR